MARMSSFMIIRCDGSNDGCGQISDTLSRHMGKTCPFCDKGVVEQVQAYLNHGQSGDYVIIPADGRDDTPWQMR